MGRLSRIISVLTLGILLTLSSSYVLANETSKTYLLDYLTANLNFDRNTILVLDEGAYNIKNITIYYLKVKDGKGNKGTFYLETNSLRIFDYKPSLHDFYNFSKKIEEQLFLLMLEAPQDEKFDVLIQFSDAPSQEDANAITVTGATIQSIEGRFIAAKADKQSLVNITGMNKVEIIVSNIPAKPLNSGKQKRPIFNYLPTITLGLIFLSVIVIFYRRRKGRQREENREEK